MIPTICLPLTTQVSSGNTALGPEYHWIKYWFVNKVCQSETITDAYTSDIVHLSRAITPYYRWISNNLNHTGRFAEKVLVAAQTVHVLGPNHKGITWASSRPVFDGWTTDLKKIYVKMGSSSPNFRGEH